ncbi:transcription termination/antitermination NusG family protein [Sinorhizobium fredii]|uniref:transcription termination/antitermination NusG family protein n=1 Tax=Rhizobium fredii TaxID=380 RepID=UPI00210CFDFC|nr:transcription termination/antitermination NusG family protein [Sinorhizobium fredii]UTY50440.1 hypothetical protein EPK84_28650 [Sinorhizobium fredii]
MNINSTKQFSAESWYAIRVAPGGQKMAKAVPGASEERVGEAQIERECREKGFAIFMPSFWTVVRHQRTNKLIEKRFPLLVGYAFVRVSGQDIDRVKQLNYVAYFLRGGGHYGLASFGDQDIAQLYIAELEKRQEHMTMKQNGEADVRKHRRNALHHQLGLIFPKGRRKRVPLRMLASAAMNSLPTKAKKRCMSILMELEALDKEEVACNTNGLALSSAA